MNEPSDSELLRAYFQEGSECSFSSLVERHLALVYSAALRVVVDPHLAQDVTQTTFAILAREARYLAGRTVLSSWLHRTATNQAAKLVRGEMRRRAREQEAYAMQLTPSASEPDWNQVAPLVDAALNSLGEADRSVILLRYFEKRSALEIGRRLEVSEEAAQKRVSRALDRLRQLLASRGVTLSSPSLATLITAQAIGTVPMGLGGSVTALALAGQAASAHLSFSTLQLLFMSKLKTGALGALILAAVATPLVLQQQQLGRLRDQNHGLQEQTTSADTLRAEKEALARQLAEALREEGLSKAQLSELRRLRREVEPLRRDSQELARLRSAGVSKLPAEPADAPGLSEFMPAAVWANVGTEKPEAAIQTFFWAGLRGETNLMVELLRWRRDPGIPVSEELDQMFSRGLIGGTSRLAATSQGFRIHSIEPVAEDEVRLSLELTNSEGKAEKHPLRLVREENQWYPVVHLWKQGEESIRATMELPSHLTIAR